MNVGGNWDWGRAIPFLGIHKSEFICSAGAPCRAAPGYADLPWILYSCLEYVLFFVFYRRYCPLKFKIWCIPYSPYCPVLEAMLLELMVSCGSVAGPIHRLTNARVFTIYVLFSFLLFFLLLNHFIWTVLFYWPIEFCFTGCLAIKFANCCTISSNMWLLLRSELINERFVYLLKEGFPFRMAAATGK